MSVNARVLAKDHKTMPIVLITVGIVPILYVLFPLLHVLASTPLSNYGSALQNSGILSAMQTSCIAALISTLAALIFGLPSAYILATKNFVGRSIVEGALLLPLLLPPIVGGVSLLDAFGPNSIVGAVFEKMHLSLTNSIIGVVLAQVYITGPFVILSAKAGFQAIPRELMEATAIEGGNSWTLFWRILIPLSSRAILTGAALTFSRAIGEFGATMITAYHPYTLPVDIWVQFSSGGLQAIVPITALVLCLAILIAIVISIGRWLKRRLRKKTFS